MARKGPLARLVVASLALAPLDLLDQPSKLLESVGVLKSLLKGAKRILQIVLMILLTCLYLVHIYNISYLYIYIYKHAYINMYHVYIHCICMDHTILYIYQHKSSLP